MLLRRLCAVFVSMHTSKVQLPVYLTSAMRTVRPFQCHASPASRRCFHRVETRSVQLLGTQSRLPRGSGETHKRHSILVANASSVAADAAIDDSTFVGDAPRSEDGVGALMEEMKDCRSMQDIIEVIQDEATEMSAAEVSLALYRLGYLSKSASKKEKDELMRGDPYKALLALVLQTHKEMTPTDVCKSVWALATMKSESSRAVTAALSNTWLNTHLQSASLLDNCQMLWSLGSIYSRSNDTVALDTVTQLLRKCREQISDAGRQKEDIEKCVSMAITGAAKLRFRLLKQSKKHMDRTKTMAELRQTASAYLRKNMASVSGRALANILRSLADLETNSDEIQKLLDAASTQMRERPGDFNSQERCMLVGTFAAQRLHPGVMINECVNKCLKDSALTPYTAAQLLLALARYGTPTQAALSLAEVVCPPSSPQAPGDTPPPKKPDLEALVNAAWSLGVLEHAQAQVTKRVAATAAEALSAALDSPQPPPSRVLRKAYHAQLMLRQAGGELPLSEEVASLAAAEWAVALWPDEAAGLVQLRFTRFLDAMEVPYTANVPAADGRLRIDVLLRRTMDQHPVAVMFSPASHYITGHGVASENWQATGPVNMETKLLEAEGLAVVRVPATPFRHVPNFQFITFVEKVLQKSHVQDFKFKGIEAVAELQLAEGKRKKSEQEQQGYRTRRQPNALQLHAELQALPDDDSDLGARRSGTPSRRVASDADDSQADEATGGDVDDVVTIPDGSYDEVLGPDSDDFIQASRALEGAPAVPGGFFAQDTVKGGFVGYPEVPANEASGKFRSWEDWDGVKSKQGGKGPEKVAVTGREWEIGMPLDDPNMVPPVDTQQWDVLTESDLPTFTSFKRRALRQKGGASSAEPRWMDQEHDDDDADPFGTIGGVPPQAAGPQVARGRGGRGRMHSNQHSDGASSYGRGRGGRGRMHGNQDTEMPSFGRGRGSRGGYGFRPRPDDGERDFGGGGRATPWLGGQRGSRDRRWNEGGSEEDGWGRAGRGGRRSGGRGSSRGSGRGGRGGGSRGDGSDPWTVGINDFGDMRRQQRGGGDGENASRGQWGAGRGRGGGY